VSRLSETCTIRYGDMAVMMSVTHEVYVPSVFRQPAI
jgi:hypothetical protein